MASGKITLSSLEDGERLVSLDETDVPFNGELPRPVYCKNGDMPSAVHQMGHTEMKITYVAGTTGGGTLLPPFFIVANTAEELKVLNWHCMVNNGTGEPTRATAVGSKNGGMTGVVWSYYLKHVLLPFLGPRIAKGDVMLTFDGASPHITANKDMAELPAGLHVLLRPPHTRFVHLKAAG